MPSPTATLCRWIPDRATDQLTPRADAQAGRVHECHHGLITRAAELAVAARAGPSHRSTLLLLLLHCRLFLKPSVPQPNTVVAECVQLAAQGDIERYLRLGEPCRLECHAIDRAETVVPDDAGGGNPTSKTLKHHQAFCKGETFK